MCYDRTSAGRKPMCATVCPSGALFFGTRAELEQQRPRSVAVNRFQFGRQMVTTKVNLMVPRIPVRSEYVDVAGLLDEGANGKRYALDLMSESLHTGERGQ
jgi:Fe-S-cluster-containing dehydrogenase component